MLNKEKTYVIKTLDMAIDNLSRAEYTIRTSYASTKTDITLSEEMFVEAQKIRKIRNTLKDMYKEDK